MIVMVIIMMMIKIGINKSPNTFLCCFASYSATLTEGWNNFGSTSLLLLVFVPYSLHVPSCKHSNRGCGVAEGVIVSTVYYLIISNFTSNIHCPQLVISRSEQRLRVFYIILK